MKWETSQRNIPLVDALDRSRPPGRVGGVTGAGGTGIVVVECGDEPQVGQMSQRRQKLWSTDNISEDAARRRSQTDRQAGGPGRLSSCASRAKQKQNRLTRGSECVERATDDRPSESQPATGDVERPQVVVVDLEEGTMCRFDRISDRHKSSPSSISSKSLLRLATAQTLRHYCCTFYVGSGLCPMDLPLVGCTTSTLFFKILLKHWTIDSLSAQRYACTPACCEGCVRLSTPSHSRAWSSRRLHTFQSAGRTFDDGGAQINAYYDLLSRPVRRFTPSDSRGWLSQALFVDTAIRPPTEAISPSKRIATRSRATQHLFCRACSTNR
ncbi:hypothetical protein C8F01DRAFT_1086453 [Mycena amicta]|nr:hypothetical protein C8F01DRAFT_1086453 [Mycena amicta]